MIPLSSIVYKYTSGGEFMNPLTHQNYIGYYYEFNGKFYVGQEFDFKSPQIIKTTSQSNNPLRKTPLNSLYSFLSNITLPNSNLPTEILDPLAGGTKYIAKQINNSKIFFINEETYKNEKNNPLYAIIEIEYDPEFGFIVLEENRKIIPEIDSFVREYGLRPDDDIL